MPCTYQPFCHSEASSVRSKLDPSRGKLMPADRDELPNRKLLPREVSSPPYSKYTEKGTLPGKMNSLVIAPSWLPNCASGPCVVLSYLEGLKNALKALLKDESRVPPPYCMIRLRPSDQPLAGSIDSCSPMICGLPLVIPASVAIRSDFDICATHSWYPKPSLVSGV